MAETTRDPNAIRAGIERARMEIEQSVADLRANVNQTLEWKNFVRRHPAACFGGAVAAGILLARWTSR